MGIILDRQDSSFHCINLPSEISSKSVRWCRILHEQGQTDMYVSSTYREQIIHINQWKHSE